MRGISREEAYPRPCQTPYAPPTHQDTAQTICTPTNHPPKSIREYREMCRSQEIHGLTQCIHLRTSYRPAE